MGKKEEGILSSPPPTPLSFFGSHFISRAVKTENLPRSFFAPKPNGNACYADYPLRLDKACIRIVSRSVAFSDRKRTVPRDQSQNLLMTILVTESESDSVSDLMKST